jgi:hypothetical protein
MIETMTYREECVDTEGKKAFHSIVASESEESLSAINHGPGIFSRG